MFDELKEKTGIYAKLGSFYTQVMTDKYRATGHRLSHVAFSNSLFQIFNSIQNNLLGYQYSNRRHLSITYQDSDLKYGTYSKSILGIPTEEEINILPDVLQGNADKVNLDSSSQLAYVLKVPDDVYVRIIQYADGSVLVDGVNFKSQYGKIIFTESPISLFKGMNFFVLSYTKRERNIMCYPLQLQDVYGDVSHVVQYYKNNQSLEQFKKALYQAVSIPVVKYKESIIDRVQLPNGMSYVMTSGIQYDADFPHTYLNIGDTLEKDYIIGGEEFLKVYLPTDIIPSDIRAVNIQNMSITGDKDLYVHNIESTLYFNNLFHPQNFVNGDGSQYYIDYVNNIGLLQKATNSIPDKMNCIDFLRNVVANNRCIILDIDKEKIPYDIAMKLKSFIIDHAPIGVVIAEALKTGDVPPIIIDTPTAIACFGNESLPDRPFITDSFYLQSVGDTTVTLNNGDTIFFDASVGNFYAGDRNGTVEKQWSNTKATQQINEALNLSNGFTNADFSELSVIYYTATGNGGSKSTITLDVSATAQVGDKIVLVVSCAAREQHTAGFSIEGITEDSIKLGYAGLGGDGFSYVQGASVTYSSDKASNWSPNAESVQIFKVEGILQSTQLVIEQPGTWKNGWQFVGYRTIHQEE